MARTVQLSPAISKSPRSGQSKLNDLQDPLVDPLTFSSEAGASARGGDAGGLLGLLQGGGAAIQFKYSSGSSGPRDLERASAGLSGGGGELPHRERIESSFGVDLGGVRAHTGSAAAAACDSLGAQGYATGGDVAFADSSPSVEVAAHEAAHVVQQQSGVHLSSKVGQPGDRYEQQADAAAARVVSGQSAADLLPTGGSAGGEAVQLKRESSEDSSWTSSDSGKTLLTSSQVLYASKSLIKDANKKLEKVGKNGSFIHLTEDGETYDHEGHSLTRVLPQWSDHKDMGDHQGASDANEFDVADSDGITGQASRANDPDGHQVLALWADCGRSSGAVTGSLEKNNSDRSAVYKKGRSTKKTHGRRDDEMDPLANTSVGRMANAIYFDLMPGFIKEKKNLKYMTEGVHYDKGTKGKITPKPITNGVEAQEMYGQLTEEGRKAFDKAAGINTYANPEIGDAYAMGTGYDMPGFKKLSKSTWNFHWGGVIMKDGPDNITLENYAVIAKGIDRFINRDWNFALYGTMGSKGGAKDTFHSEHLASKTHGSHATSMTVRTDK